MCSSGVLSSGVVVVVPGDFWRRALACRRRSPLLHSHTGEVLLLLLLLLLLVPRLRAVHLHFDAEVVLAVVSAVARPLAVPSVGLQYS